MALFRRRAALPDDVRSALRLGPRERVLAVAPLTDGWVVATTHRLHVVTADAAPLHRAWIDVNAGRLDPESAMLTVTWVDGAAPTDLHLADNRSMELPRVFRECVNTSLVHSESVTLRSGAVVRVALRRDADDALSTQVLGTGDVDLSDPATAAAVDAVEARVRDAAGLA
jgi:hypothetical protein